MKIYVAGVFESKERLSTEAGRLRELGYEVISSWLMEPTVPAEATKGSWENFAARDLVELRAADCIILDTFDITPRGGREVEWGYMLHRPGIQRYIVGPIRNVFHTFATRRFETWDECLKWFEASLTFARRS